MKKATKSEIAAIVLAFITLFVVMTAGITAVWLTSEVRVFGLVMLPTAIVAGLLVVVTSTGGRHCVTESWRDRDHHKKAA